LANAEGGMHVVFALEGRAAEDESESDFGRRRGLLEKDQDVKACIVFFALLNSTFVGVAVFVGVGADTGHPGDTGHHTLIVPAVNL
jgi:hypothetical protein